MVLEDYGFFDYSASEAGTYEYTSKEYTGALRYRVGDGIVHNDGSAMAPSATAIRRPRPLAWMRRGLDSSALTGSYCERTPWRAPCRWKSSRASRPLRRLPQRSARRMICMRSQSVALRLPVAAVRLR